MLAELCNTCRRLMVSQATRSRWERSRWAGFRRHLWGPASHQSHGHRVHSSRRSARNSTNTATASCGAPATALAALAAWRAHWGRHGRHRQAAAMARSNLPPRCAVLIHLALMLNIAHRHSWQS